MRIAACQTPDVCGAPTRAVEHMRDFAERAASQGARLVCFPEAFLPGYRLDRSHIEGSAVDLTSSALSELLRPLASLEPTLVFGVFERAPEGLYNTAIVVERGRVVGAYRKRNLLRPERTLFRPGRAQPLFRCDGLGFSVNICYDLQFPEPAQDASAAGASLLVCPSNNMLPRSTAERWRGRHHASRRQRAIDANLWVLTADVTGGRGTCISYGPTALIDPAGRIVEELPLGEPGLLVIDVPVQPAQRDSSH